MNKTSFPSEHPELLSETTGKASLEEINSKVQHAQEQLLELKRQQEDIERQKRELEDLSRTKREFEDGRREILEKLTRGLVLLERQESEIKHEAEQVTLIRENFHDQLKEVEKIDPLEWSNETLSSDLTRALARVDQAQVVYAQSHAKLQALRNLVIDESQFAPENGAEGDGFMKRVQIGFAYSLPAIIFGIIILIVLLSR
jgi:hypothetical protein